MELNTELRDSGAAKVEQSLERLMYSKSMLEQSLEDLQKILDELIWYAPTLPGGCIVAWDEEIANGLAPIRETIRRLTVLLAMCECDIMEISLKQFGKLNGFCIPSIRRVM